MTSMQVSSRLSGRAGRLPAFGLRAVYWREGAGKVAGAAGAGAREPPKGQGPEGAPSQRGDTGNFPPPGDGVSPLPTEMRRRGGQTG